jgi:hypothetical protein
MLLPTVDGAANLDGAAAVQMTPNLMQVHWYAGHRLMPGVSKFEPEAVELHKRCVPSRPAAQVAIASHLPRVRSQLHVKAHSGSRVTRHARHCSPACVHPSAV